VHGSPTSPRFPVRFPLIQIDARARAEQIASQGGRTIKDLRAARMGVVQINPLHSTATSWDGNSDTSAVDKTMTVTVSATFSLK
jgi:hypothetical protein